MKNYIYQCKNPKCDLRFPAHETAEFNQRCPKCLGLVEVECITESQIEFKKDTSDSLHNFVVVLDNIRSAFNVGAILRTSECFGILHVHLCGITPPITDKNVQKASVGSEKHLDITSHNNGVRLTDRLKQEGYKIWSIELDEMAINLNHARVGTEPIALVVGSERCGVDPEILRRSDQILQIPMSGIKNSLNVEVSFGIALNILRSVNNI